MKKYISWGLFCLLFQVKEACAQGLSGSNGLFHVPVAYLPEDRTAIAGVHFLHRDYASYKYRLDKTHQWHGMAAFVTVAFLPRMEFQFRYTHLLGREISSSTRYFPDRMLTFRFLALKERRYVPALTLGLQDPTYLFGGEKGYYTSHYAVASKSAQSSRFRVSGHLGYGFPLLSQQRSPDRVYYQGLFGGTSFSLTRFPSAEFVLEHDSQYWNMAVKILFLKHLQVLAGLHQGRAFSGGLSWKGVLSGRVSR